MKKLSIRNMFINVLKDLQNNMRVYKIKNINKFKYRYKKQHIVCMGFFDGVHIGHQAIINEVLKLKEQYPNYELSLVTIDQKINKQKIYQSQHKREIFKNKKFDNYFEIILNKTNLNVTKEEYISFLKKTINVKKIVIGSDYRFGYKAEGSVNDLQKHFADNVIVMPFIKRNGKKISSSFIKKMLITKEIQEANDLMFDDYNYTNVIIHGNKNGRKINYPTINMLVKKPLLIPYGIYITTTIIKNKCYKSITCYYPKNNVILLETFILDFKQYVYGQVAKINFLNFLRENVPIKSIFDLIPLINNDLKITLKYFQNRKNNV